MFYASRMAMCRALIPKLAYDNNSLVFWTTCGPATTFDPKITGVAGTWFFDDGTALAAASGAEISKTFAAEGLHRAVYRPASGGLAAITAIDANTDLLTSVWGIEKISALSFLSLSINAGLVISLASIPPTTTLYARDCNYISGSLSQLKDGCQTVYLYRSPSVLPGSISHLTTIRELGVYTLGWLTADVDVVLLSIANAIVADAAHFTYATPALQIGWNNEAPSGTYQAPTGPGGTPTSGLEAVWIMTHNTGHTWTVSATGGSYP